MPEEIPKIPRIELIESPDFKVTYSSGVFGNLHEGEGTIIFYLDRPVPIMKEGQDMGMSHVQRDLQIEIHLTHHVFELVYNWMGTQIERVKKEREKVDT